MKGAREMDKVTILSFTISRHLEAVGPIQVNVWPFELNALYLDHQLVFEAAKELKIPEEDVVFSR